MSLAAPRQYPDALMGTQMSILCNDTPFRGDRRSLEREGNKSVRQYSLVGGYQVTGPCAWWDRPDVQPQASQRQGASTPR